MLTKKVLDRYEKRDDYRVIGGHDDVPFPITLYSDRRST
jgi:hypothetical protein